MQVDMSLLRGVSRHSTRTITRNVRYCRSLQGRRCAPSDRIGRSNTNRVVNCPDLSIPEEFLVSPYPPSNSAHRQVDISVVSTEPQDPPNQVVSFQNSTRKNMFGSYRDAIASPREGKDRDSSEAEPFILSDSIPQKQRTAWGTYLTALHSITTVVLAFICIGLLHEHGAPRGTGSFERGFKTELSYMFPALELEEKTFHFLKSGEEDTHRDYVGRRTPDIDHAWNKLLHCESVSWPGVVTQYEAKKKEAANLDFTDDEAGPELRNTTWKWEDTGYWFSGVSMWHQLHCLNFLREAVHWDSYDGPPGPPVQFHLDHCVNYLRQVVMCYADLTPMRYGWNEGAGRLVLQDEPHTCRNYEKIDELARPLASCHNLDFSKPKGWGTSPRGTCVRGPYFKDL